MYPIIFLNCDLDKRYDKYNLFSRLSDNMRMKFRGESLIKELGVNIAKVELPPNFNKQAYLRNVQNSKRFIYERNGILSPKTLRTYDYRVLNSFQRELIAYGIVKSIQLMLRTCNKSIKNSCIVVYDALNDISIGILHELAKHAKYIVIMSNNAEKLSREREYIVSNYGITPVITNEIKYALEAADFIVTSREIEVGRQVPVWFIDNDYKPSGNNKFYINDISFIVPWDTEFKEMSPELLGGILSQMGERDIDKSLRYNGVYLDKIKFNNKIVEI